MAHKTSRGGDWSFSLRSGNYLYGTSSSDDDSDDGLSRPAPDSACTGEKTQPSEEARLLGELDLASRTDSASYKPNPWTIAKANAAVRAPRPSAPTKEARQKKHHSTQATVLDLLRAQPKTIPTGRACQMQSVVQEPTTCKSGSPDRLVSDDAHISSDDTLVDTLDPVVFSKLDDNDSTVVPSFSLLSPSGAPPGEVVVPDPQSRQCHPASPSRSSYLINHYRIGTHHRVPAEVPLPPSDRLSAGQELRAMLFHSSPTGHTLKEASASQPSQLTHAIAPASRTASLSLFPGKWHLWSLLVQLIGPHSPSSIRPRSSVPILPLETGGLPLYQSSSQSSPIPTRAYNPPTRDPSPYPASSPHRSQAIGRGATLDRFAFRPSSPPRPPFAQPFATRQPSSSPSPHHSRSSPRLSITRGSRASRAPPRKVPKRCAYEAFSSPDSSWHTILPGKNHKQKGNDGTKPVTTTNFRLRLQAACPTNESRKGREDAASETADAKPRVVTPLPRGRDIDTSHEPCPSLSNHSGSVTSPDDQDPHPTPVFRPMAIRRAAPPHMSLPAYRAPTSAPYPPSRRHGSERPSPYRGATYDVDGDRKLSFNQSGLSQRYSSLRRGIAKVGSFVGQTAFCPFITPWCVLFLREYR
ncbi:hypothetical protein V8D89_011570 [Ganoderma adspersum]